MENQLMGPARNLDDVGPFRVGYLGRVDSMRDSKALDDQKYPLSDLQHYRDSSGHRAIVALVIFY